MTSFIPRIACCSNLLLFKVVPSVFSCFIFHLKVVFGMDRRAAVFFCTDKVDGCRYDDSLPHLHGGRCWEIQNFQIIFHCADCVLYLLSCHLCLAWKPLGW